MFMGADQLQAELPPPQAANQDPAAVLQELLGGKYSKMSTLGNYMCQIFNFRYNSALRPFYSLVASITAEELGDVELVSAGIAMRNNGQDIPDSDAGDGGDISGAPLKDMTEIRLAAIFLHVEAARHRSTATFSCGTKNS